MAKVFVPTVGDRVSFVLPNGRRAQGIFKGYFKNSAESGIVRVWKCARKNADGDTVGTAGFAYANADTLKRGRKVRPLKRFGQVIGQYDVRTGFELDTDTDSEV